MIFYSDRSTRETILSILFMFYFSGGFWSKILGRPKSLYRNSVWGLDISVALLIYGSNYPFDGGHTILLNTPSFHIRVLFVAIYSDHMGYNDGFFLYNLRKRRLVITKSVTPNLFTISLAIITVIIAISGCVGYSENVYFEEFGADDLWVLQGLPPSNLFTYLRAINVFGILLCEPAWIITVLSKYLKHWIIIVNYQSLAVRVPKVPEKVVHQPLPKFAN